MHVPIIAAVVLLALSLFGSGPAAAAPTYVGSESCADCHEDAARAWKGSQHALAWTMPGPDTVLADFDGTAFEGDDLSARFRIENGAYYATVTESDGSQREYRIHSVAGVAPLQQYLIETEPGRLQAFDIAWDTVRKRWFDIYPEQELPPGDALHWTGPYKTWNARCAECHATGYRRNYSARTRSYSSTQAEIGVGCEACHGPGSAHLEWTKGKTPGEGLDRFGFTMSFGAGNTGREIEQCATCHSRREALTDGNPLPGTPFDDAHNLAPLRPGLYHPDGQILDEVYVYGSFLQSRMFDRGVGCMACHEPHKATVKADDNSLCTQCHSTAGNDAFPTLKRKDYDSRAHTRHEPGTEAAACKSCHMIERVYMAVDGRRDHSFRVPRPDLGLQTGAPDACTDCHEDQSQTWAAARIAEWFPDSDNRGPHFGTAFAQAVNDPQGAADALQQIALDAAAPGIVRATAMLLLGPVSSPALADRSAPLLSDPDPLVRRAAAGLQRGAAPADRVAALMPVLADPVRSVRIAAARQMLDIDTAALRPSQQAMLGEAMADWRASLGNKLDFPETHMVLGGIALTLRDAKTAERAFREVVRLDPQRREAWRMLVRLTQLSRGAPAARAILDDALRRVPGDPELLRLKSQLGG